MNAVDKIVEFKFYDYLLLLELGVAGVGEPGSTLILAASASVRVCLRRLPRGVDFLLFGAGTFLRLSLGS